MGAPEGAWRQPPQWALVDIERYEVRNQASVLGYVDVVGRVFVALAGERYDRATEIAQTLRFEHAIDALMDAADRRGIR